MLERSAWFRAAPETLRAQLVQLGRVERLQAGERLFMRGDPDDGIYCLLDGLVRIGAASFAGGGRENLPSALRSWNRGAIKRPSGKRLLKKWVFNRPS